MKLALLGDIALFGRLSYKNSNDIDCYFKDVANLLGTMDYVVGNLESPFSVKKKTHGSKSAYICSDVENVKTLKQLHINAVCLANNHMFDYGMEGYETTKSVLDNNGIDYFGSEGREIHVCVNNSKLAFSGFCCYSSNPLRCVEFGNYGINEYNIKKVEQVIKRNRENGELNIVSVHAGIEHVNYPSVDHIKAAREIAGIAPIVYYGHHPHVVQGIEKYEESLIAYSLGNFCFDDVYSSASKAPLITLSENNRSSCILVVEIENSLIKNWSTIPLYIGKDKIYVDKGVTQDELERYSVALQNAGSKEYNIMRDRLMNDYFTSRMTGRSVSWYLKRLRPRYLGIILNARKNEERYLKCVKKYI